MVALKIIGSPEVYGLFSNSVVREAILYTFNSKGKVETAVAENISNTCNMIVTVRIVAFCKGTRNRTQFSPRFLGQKIS